MISRMIRPDEKGRCDELFSIAFDIPMTREAYEHRKEIRDSCLRYASFLDDDSTMISKFVLNPYTMTYEGAPSLMFGVGGVSTLPAYRHMGGIRGCFEVALPEMYRSGAAFSMLYPFSHAFYRKFGYELGLTCAEWTVRLQSIPRLAKTGSCTLLDPDHTMEVDVLSLCHLFENRFNGMVISRDAGWVRKTNPYTDRQYTYLFRGPNGLPWALAAFTPMTGPEQASRWLNCTRLIFTSPQSLMDVLQFFSGYASDYACVRFRLPESVPLSGILPEFSLNSVEVRHAETAMVRAINAAYILEHMRAYHDGQFTLELHDDLIPENNGLFSVTLCPGGTNHVTRLKDGKPDLQTDIQTFSRLAIRRNGMEQAPWLPGMHLMHDAPALRSLFYASPGYITESF